MRGASALLLGKWHRLPKIPPAMPAGMLLKQWETRRFAGVPQHGAGEGKAGRKKKNNCILNNPGEFWVKIVSAFKLIFKQGNPEVFSVFSAALSCRQR